ncbi:MAG: histidine kinase [Lachnospiraceae bacterium]|nr:histidine kinase [Lachnospiraceae bacterium]
MFSFVKHSKNNIQQLLTSYFILLMSILLVAVTLVFSVVQYRILTENTINTLRNSCNAIADSIDLQIGQMNTISLNSINSADLKETLNGYISTESNAYQHNLVRQRLSSVLISLKGFDYSIRQLNLYAMTGAGYGVGNYNGELTSTGEEEWFLETLNRNGHLYIASHETDPLTTKGAGTGAAAPMFSIYRMFFDEYHNPIGIVAVKKYAETLFQAATSPDNGYLSTVVIYDGEGNVVFPYEEGVTEQLFDYYSALSDEDGMIRNTNEGYAEYICSCEMPESGFTAVMAVRKLSFMTPIYRSLFLTIVTFLVIFAMCLLLARFLSRKISTPISRIHRFLADEKKPAFQTLDLPDTGIEELDALRDSVNESIRIREADTKTMIMLNEQEVQAQMLALQSQMNPHFLYNSLASIAEMAREGHTDQVEVMTINISKILRYISSNREQVTSLEEELELCDMYLECMKLRFGEDLEYCFDVEDTMLDYQIPKLCVQLLIENAIKSVTSMAPPWKITVTGYSEVVDGDARWYVTVKDNGPGFDPAVDQHLRAQMDEILRTRTLPSLKIEGMGILNIFIRFYLLDGITFLFDFGNCPEGGAYIMVGRHIQDADQSH